MTPLEYLAELQAEAVRGFHQRKSMWVTDDSSVARALRDLHEEQSNHVQISAVLMARVIEVADVTETTPDFIIHDAVEAYIHGTDEARWNLA